MSARTVRDFTASANIWPIVEAWAGDSKYHLRTSSESTRLYQRGHGVWMAPMMLELRQTGDKVHMEAWVRVGLMMRLLALFLIPTEMGLESGGFRLTVPRRTARGSVNELLGKLGQSPIE